MICQYRGYWFDREHVEHMDEKALNALDAVRYSTIKCPEGCSREEAIQMVEAAFRLEHAGFPERYAEIVFLD